MQSTYLARMTNFVVVEKALMLFPFQPGETQIETNEAIRKA